MEVRRSRIPRMESICSATEVRESLPVSEERERERERVRSCAHVDRCMWVHVAMGFLYDSLSSVNFIVKAVKSH